MSATFVAYKKSAATFVADISPNCRPTFLDDRPITASDIEVSHDHPLSTCPFSTFCLTGRRQTFCRRQTSVSVNSGFGNQTAGTGIVRCLYGYCYCRSATRHQDGDIQRRTVPPAAAATGSLRETPMAGPTNGGAENVGQDIAGQDNDGQEKHHA